MASIKEAILAMALDKFKAELKKPNSATARKFHTLLYGDPATGAKGLFDKFSEIDFEDKLPAEQENTPDKPEEDTNTDKSKKDPIDKEMERYKRNRKQAALDIGLATLGNIGKGTGRAISGGASMLGDALISMSRSNDTIKNPIAPFAGAVGGLLGAGGKIAGGMSEMLGNAISAIGADIKNNREKERETELLLREHPNGAFYDARRKLTTGVQRGH